MVGVLKIPLGKYVDRLQGGAECELELGRPADALPQYEASIAKEPNRFRGLYGAGLAAERAGDHARARGHFEKLVALCAESEGARPELVQVRQALAQR